ncbi:DM13 domain-containing protein [Kribbella sp. NBC_01505]|uniref:DM13 domain-containing protein n=1 Tax=Kribbella sp. NBC_01505 TaxID=2903580 RepID=UPI00386D1126
MKRTALVATAAVAVLAAAAIALPLFQPWRLLTDKAVDDALPGASPSSVPISIQPSSTTPPTVSVAPTSGPPATTAPKTPATTKVLSKGSLISHEHGTSGDVAVLRLPDGSRVLRLENLDTSDGPDLRVWLSDAAVLPGRAGWHVFDDGRYQALGRLKGNQGNQNYPIPASVQLDDFRSVTIWCDRFNVSFGAAELKSV